jgi:hypothetical protein
VNATVAASTAKSAVPARADADAERWPAGSPDASKRLASRPGSWSRAIRRAVRWARSARANGTVLRVRRRMRPRFVCRVMAYLQLFAYY